MKQPIPILETDQLKLRPLTQADAPAVFAYASDPCVSQFTHWAAHLCLEDSHNFIARTHAQALIWGIEHKETKTIIGECGLAHIELPKAEIYYALNRQWWGHGLAGQAIAALSEYSFKQLSIKHLDAWIIKDNLRSHRVAQKAGMECTMIYPQQWYADNALHDVHLYSKHI